MKNGVAAILMLLICPSIGLAQSATRESAPPEGPTPIARMVEIGQRRRPAALELWHSGHALSGDQNQAQPKARSGHPVLIGAAIGAGSGFLLNATACRTGESVCTGAGNLLMAGIGALVGVLVSRH